MVEQSGRSMLSKRDNTGWKRVAGDQYQRALNIIQK